MPFYNFYGIFRWPTALARFVNWRTQAKRMRGRIAGLLVLAAVLTFRLFDGFVGAMLLFGSGWYMCRCYSRIFRQVIHFLGFVSRKLWSTAVCGYLHLKAYMDDAVLPDWALAPLAPIDSYPDFRKHLPGDRLSNDRLLDCPGFDANRHCPFIRLRIDLHERQNEAH